MINTIIARQSHLLWASSRKGQASRALSITCLTRQLSSHAYAFITPDQPSHRLGLCTKCHQCRQRSPQTRQPDSWVRHFARPNVIQYAILHRISHSYANIGFCRCGTASMVQLCYIPVQQRTRQLCPLIPLPLRLHS